MAYLVRANLLISHLKSANLTGAHLERANLIYAHLEGARLGRATGLTRDQLAVAIIDKDTKLPDYLKETQPEKPESK